MSTMFNPIRTITNLVPLLLTYSRPRLRDERGQSTVEYALVVLGAAAVALLLVTWAAGSGKVTALFDQVFDSVVGKVV